MSGTVLDLAHQRGAGSSPASPQGHTAYGSVERVQLSLPPGFYAACPDSPTGVPGFGALAGGAYLDTSAVGGGNGAVNTFANAALAPELLATVRSASKGPVRAIAIAADSPISECDLWTGDPTKPNRFRLAPGRPYIGDVSALDHLLVTLPRAIPNPWDDPANGETVAAWLAENMLWDGQITNITTTGVEPRVESAYPLRLELYRGELPPVVFQKRAPVYADMFVSLDTTNIGTVTYGKLWVATQGRSAVDITVSNRDGAGGQMQVVVTGYKPTLQKTVAGRPESIRRRSARFAVDTFLVSDGDDVSRTYTNLRYPLMGFRIEPVTGTTHMTAALAVEGTD